LARPISREEKEQLVADVNRVLDGVRATMDEILRESSQLKGKESAIIKDIFVTAHSWKTGIRKIQTKVSNFYSVKMKYFQMINECC
jgi:hypothetical protein